MIKWTRYAEDAVFVDQELYMLQVTVMIAKRFEIQEYVIGAYDEDTQSFELDYSGPVHRSWVEFYAYINAPVTDQIPIDFPGT